MARYFAFDNIFTISHVPARFRVAVACNGVDESPWPKKITGSVLTVVRQVPSQCAFLPPGIVSMMDRIATATMSTLNISAIIAATRTARLSCRP
jgi:hypothetical protein